MSPLAWFFVILGAVLVGVVGFIAFAVWFVTHVGIPE